MTVSVPDGDIDDVGRLVGERLRSEIAGMAPPHDLLAHAHRRHGRYRRRRRRTILVALCAGVTALLALTLSIPTLIPTRQADTPPAATSAAPAAAPLEIVEGPWSPWQSSIVNNMFTVGACTPQVDSIGQPGTGSSAGDCNGTSGLLRTDRDSSVALSWHFLLPEKPAHCTVRLYIPDSDIARGQARYDLYPYDADPVDTEPGVRSFGLHQNQYRGKWVEYGAGLSIDNQSNHVTMRLSRGGRDSTVLAADVAQLRCTLLRP